MDRCKECQWAGKINLCVQYPCSIKESWVWVWVQWKSLPVPEDNLRCERVYSEPDEKGRMRCPHQRIINGLCMKHANEPKRSSTDPNDRVEGSKFAQTKKETPAITKPKDVETTTSKLEHDIYQREDLSAYCRRCLKEEPEGYCSGESKRRERLRLDVPD